MTAATGAVMVAAFYRFAALPAPTALRAPLLALARAGGVRGTVLLAHEGINGTIAGPEAGVRAVLDRLRALPGCDDLSVKFARADTLPFHRMKVRVKREIVSMGEAVDARSGTGVHVAPAEWDALIAQDDTLLIDTRNDYEIAVGTFPGAVDPGTRSFTEFPGWFRAHHKSLMAGKRRVAMFCTGGIRCEKATALLKAEGVEEVYHLDGGVLRYLEEVPAAQNRWTGECFVFDERVAVGPGLSAGTHTLCRACRMPVSSAERASPLHVAGISCPRCHATRSDGQRAGYAERHRQVALGAARGDRHVGGRDDGEPSDGRPAPK